jgi:replicative DNA helicase
MTRSTDISPLSVLLSRVDAVSDGAPPVSTIPTGFASVDKMLGGGLRHGDFVIIGGDTASGKSALSLAFAVRMSLAGAQTVFLTAEMSGERVLERILAIEARTRIDDLRQGTLDDVARANAGAIALRLREHLPVVDRIPSGGVGAISGLLDAVPRADVLFIDGLATLAAESDGTHDERIAHVVRDLKALAVELDAVIVATAPARDLEGRSDRRPMLDDFGARGAIKDPPATSTSISTPSGCGSRTCSIRRGRGWAECGEPQSRRAFLRTPYAALLPLAQRYIWG